MAPRLAVRDIALFRTPGAFRAGRSGSAPWTVNASTQIFVRVEIRGRRQGKVGRLRPRNCLAPKWFDKRPHLSSEENGPPNCGARS